jgi:hypothetical protein
VMLVNLFDFNFRQSVCSVAYQTPQHIEYVRDLTDFDGVTLFTDGYINDGSADRVRSRYKMAWLREPYCLHPDIYEAALTNAHKFDLVLTYYQPFLDRGDNFRFCPYGGTWIDRSQWGIKPKTKLCSMLIGSKMSTRGHTIRHEIADMITLMGYDVDFYGVRGTPVGYGQDTKMQVLSDYAFSIVTETCREDNLFTEWLLDCFALGTIPIYWGAPNIDRFFGLRQGGIVIPLLVGGVDAMSDAWKESLPIILNHIEGKYTNRMRRIYNNLMAMQPYAVTEDWLYLNVLKDYE